MKQTFKYSLSIVLTLLALTFSALGVSPVSAAETLPESHTDTLLQFTAGRHVLGFAPQRAYLAGPDHALTVEFVGGYNVTPVDPGQGAQKIAALQKVTYAEVWPGIDVVFSAAPGALAESSYLLKPGAEAKQIRLRYNAPVTLGGDGSLAFAFENGALTESAPVAWQEIGGQRQPVAVAFRQVGPQEIGFELGAHNPAYGVVIDPLYSWHTFYGSSTGDDSGNAIAVDASGNIYITGNSSATWGTPLNPYTGTSNFFVAKLNSAGALQWNTFLGDSGGSATSIELDGSGNIYISGVGPWWGPGNVPPLNIVNASAFVVKLNNNGVYQWHTNYGSAPGNDLAFDLAVGTGGNVYIAAYSKATWNGPAGLAPLHAHSGVDSFDILVFKLNSSGAYQWHTFYGAASYDDAGVSLALDGSENVYVTGFSGATWNGPAGETPLRAFAAANIETTVLKLSSTGAYQWHTFCGPAYTSRGYGIALDGDGNIYITGPGASSSTTGTILYVAKLNGTGAFLWGSLFGSTGVESYGILPNGDKNIYVAGLSSSAWNGPNGQLPQHAYSGSSDIFVLKLANDGVYKEHTFLGSSTGGEYAANMAMDGTGNIYLTGLSGATWTGPDGEAPLHAFAGGSQEIFVAKMTPDISLTGNAGVGGATLSYTDGIAKSVTADASGNYTLTVPYNWSGTVTPFKANTIFTPASRTYPALTSDQTAQDYALWNWPTIIRVKPVGATSGACGESWAAACDLQYALTNAPSGQELWVAAGTYKPTSGTDRTATFTLKNGVALYGGFAGTETARDQRDPATNVTILSGDLLGNDAANFANYSDNTYHVVSSSGVDSTALLDGFTVKSGSAEGGTPPAGGGMYNLNASPSVNNVIFSGNYAVSTGGAGMYNSNSHPALTNVTFADNHAASGKGGGLFNAAGSHPTLTNVTFSANLCGGYGGGLANIENSAPILTNVTFNGNKGLYGGGMYNQNSNPSLTSVTFSANGPYSTSVEGGGMYNDASSPILTDVTFTNNTTGASGTYGGGMYNRNGSAPTLTRVSFSGNVASASGGWGGGMANDASNPVLVDVIFDGNAAALGGGLRNYNSSPTLNRVFFNTNTASAFGGGLDNFGGMPSLTNVTFTANSAAIGGAIHNYQNSALTLNNVTLSGNTATTNGGGLAIASSGPQLINVILWGNSAPSGAEIYIDTGGAPVIKDSLVAGGCPAGATCTHVLTGDPKLAALADNGGFSRTLALQPGSAAIDAGGLNSTCAATDQRGVTRPQAQACDIGAYELIYTPTATSTPTATATLILPSTPTPTATLTETVTPAFTSTLTRTATATRTVKGSATPTGTATRTPTLVAPVTHTPTATPTGTATLTATPTSTPTSQLVTVAFKSQGAYDGWVLETAESSEVGGAINATASTFRLGDDANNRQYRSLLSFDTSSLPDGAVITRAALKFRQNPFGGLNLISKFGGLLVDMKRGYLGASAKLLVGDFQAKAGRTFGPFKPFPVSGWVTINLGSAAFPYINKVSTYQSGYTQIRLRFKLDDNNDHLANVMNFTSGNVASNQPQLVITYIVP